MWAYLIPSVSTIGLYYFFEKRGTFKHKKGLVVFVLLFSVLILMPMVRENIGVDYKGYLVQYDRIKQGLPSHTEIGFKYVVKFIANTYDDPRIMFALFSFFTLINMLIAIYKLSEKKTLALFLFIAMGYYNLTYNSIRYYYALSLVLLAYSFLMERKTLKFVLTILFAALFHKTALVVLPVALFFRKNLKRHYLYLVAFALFALIFKDVIRGVLFSIYPGYLGSVYDGGSVSIFNVLKGLLVLVIGVIYRPFVINDEKLAFLYKMNIFALALYVFCSWIPELSRIGYYFNITNIIFFPNLLNRPSANYDNVIIKGLLIGLFSLYLFIMLYRSYSPTIYLLPYQTWLL